MAVGPSQPHTMPQTASTTTSTKRCFRFRVCRGSESDSKYEPMDSTFTHGVVMRGIPGVSSGASRSAIASRANTAVATVYQDEAARASPRILDRKSTRLNSSHVKISYAVFCLKKKKKMYRRLQQLRITQVLV